MANNFSRRVIAALCLVAGTAGIVLGQAAVSVENLPAGGTNTFPIVVAPGQIAGFMTTPMAGSMANPYTTPDTLVAILEGATVLRENDDAAASTGNAVGVGSVSPNRGSLVRYGETSTAGPSNLTWRVRGFTATDAGAYAATTVLFTPGVTPANFVDTEPNNTAATAQSVLVPGGSAVLGYANLAAGDTDYFSVSLNAGDILSAFTIPLGTRFSVPDTLVDIRSLTDAIMATNDDAGLDRLGAAGGTNPTARGSAVRYMATANTTILLSVRPFAAVDVGDYAMVISVVPIPEPASAMLALSSVALLIRRRRI